MAETDEIVHTVERWRTAFEDLAGRGRRSAGPGDLATLDALREELQRIGADHLAGRIAAVGDAIRSGQRSAAAALMRAQASLRLFERVLTLEVAGVALRQMLP